MSCNQLETNAIYIKACLSHKEFLIEKCKENGKNKNKQALKLPKLWE